MASTDIIEKLLLKRIRIFSFLIQVCTRYLFAWWWWRSKWIFHREFLSKARPHRSITTVQMLRPFLHEHVTLGFAQGSFLSHSLLKQIIPNDDPVGKSLVA